jgi:hypothetical protein
MTLNRKRNRVLTVDAAVLLIGGAAAIVDGTESIPRDRRDLGGSDGGAHMRLVQWLLRWPHT